MTLENIVMPLIVPIVAYAAGFLSGFIMRDYVQDKVINNGAFVLSVVTIVWTLSMFIDITTPTYTTSPLVHGLMGAIVGFFYKPGAKYDKTN